MIDLTIIKQNGNYYIDSREVAELISKRHHNLLRDINGYIRILRESGVINFDYSEFFTPRTYQSEQNKEMPCYLLTKMGCEMVANKLTGEKGILFTAAYVTRYNELETSERVAERTELESLITLAHRPNPRLGEINACVRILVRGMKNLDATPEQVMDFLKETYGPFGINVDVASNDTTAPRWYNANGIARECGMYSMYGKPHSQAAAFILNEIIGIKEEHKRIEADHYGFQVGFSTLYDDYALVSLMQWLVDNGCPNNIHALGRTYYVQYLSS